MKKLFIYLSVAMLAVAAVSCQKEMVVADGENGNVTLTIQTPEVATKAIADGMNVNIVHYEIYKNEDDHKNSLSGAPLIKGTVPMNAKGASLTLNLLQGQEYVGLFWAQVDGQSYYDVTDLRDVKVAYPNETNNLTYANDEARAAFCQKKVFSTGRNVSVVLERPFAQINLGTTIADLTDDYTITLEQSSMTVTGVANTFDVAAMTAGTTANNVVFSLATVPYAFNPSETLTANNQTWAYAGMNYVLVPNDAATVDVTYSIKTDVGTVSRQVPTVPVQKNHRTNLLGNLLTQETAIEIVVDERFAEPDLEADPLFLAAAIGGEYTLTKDLILTEPLMVQSTLVLDLNGHKITAGLKQEGRHHYAIDNYGVLTLKGEGSIEGRGVENFGTMLIEGDITITNLDTNGGSAIWNEGDLVINGGTFTTNSAAGEGSYGSALNTQEGGKAVINGGNFIANSQLTYAILNYGETVINNAVVTGKHGAVAAADGDIKTVINGGTFSLMENPGVSDHCLYYVSDIKGGSFTLGNNIDSGAKVFCESTIAEGYKAVETAAGVYTVIPNSAVFAADDSAVEAALDDRTINTIYLDAKKYTIEMYTNFEAKESLTIIGTEGTKVAFKNQQVRLALCRNFTIKNCEILHMATKTWGMLVFGGRDSGAVNCTVSNCSFKGVGTQGIYINENISGAVYNIENCTFDGDFGSTDGAVTIQNNHGVAFTVNVKGCTFNMTNGSHEISHHYNDSAFTLNTDVDPSKIYCKEN